MRNLKNDYDQRMSNLVDEKTRLVKEINHLFKQYKNIEYDIEQMENDEFLRTGIFKFSAEINVKVTELDLLKELIRETEGKNIKPENPNQN